MTTNDGRLRGAIGRAIVLWSIIGAMLIGAFASAVAAVSREVYSAAGFVHQYLDALSRRDAQDALAMPGVSRNDADLQAAGLPGDASRLLLRSAALAELSNLELVGDVKNADGTQTITFRYTAAGKPGMTAFTVESTGSRFFVFPTWRFVVSPLAALDVTVKNESLLEVNGMTINAAATSNDRRGPVNRATYLVLAPAVYTLQYQTSLLTGGPARAVVETPTTVVPVTLEVGPKPEFTSQVQKQLTGFLDQCATQKVLQPTGCPFGLALDDRLVDEPTWSMVDYPAVTIVPASGDWQSGPTSGSAHLTVTVQSLYDGKINTVDKTIPFTVRLHIEIRPDESLVTTVS